MKTDLITITGIEQLPDGDYLYTFDYSGEAYETLKRCALLQYKDGRITKEDIKRFGPTKDARRTGDKIAACIGKAMLEYAEEHKDELK